jgi:hypothetical protein
LRNDPALAKAFHFWIARLFEAITVECQRW